jgi:hypothetical protein
MPPLRCDPQGDLPVFGKQVAYRGPPIVGPEGVADPDRAVTLAEPATIMSHPLSSPQSRLFGPEGSALPAQYFSFVYPA